MPHGVKGSGSCFVVFVFLSFVFGVFITIFDSDIYVKSEPKILKNSLISIKKNFCIIMILCGGWSVD